MSWHVDPTLLRRYRSEELTDAGVASVELHVTSCPTCRALVAADPGPAVGAAQSRVKLTLDDHLDAAPMATAERALRRLGVGDRDAGIVSAALALQGSWTAAFVIALVFATMAGFAGTDGGEIGMVLVVAPLLPLAGVALAFGPRVDPTYEVALATSVSAARIILLRTLAVTAPALPLLLGVSFLLPGGLLAFSWLLPAVGLAAASLALGTFVTLHRAAIGLAVAWVTATLLSVAHMERRAAPDFVEEFVAFRPSGQLLFAVLAAASIVAVVLRRFEFETAR